MKKHSLWIAAVFLYLNTSAQELSHLVETPPMGWNSWDCFGMDITEDQVKATAGYMAKYMKSFGWEYIVIDMGWYYGEGLNTSNFGMKNPPQYIDDYGRVIPALRRFPSAAGGSGFKPLADYVHSLGLKFGIHIIRGIPRQAVEKNTPIKGSTYRAKDIASEKNLCGFYHGTFTVDMTKPGSQEYYDSMIELYTEWGVDYIKADCILRPYHKLEIEAINKAIIKAGNKIVLSLSAAAIIEDADHLRQHAHLWRISGDMWDDWSYIKNTFERCREWQGHITPNHWPDCDMLPLGKLRINSAHASMARRLKVSEEELVNEYSRLSVDEKYTLLTLWYIFRSPLMMGGNLLENDSLTLRLLTNKETLEVNQKSTNNRELRSDDNEIVWVADEPGSEAKYFALFNVSDTDVRKIRITWDELGISGKHKVRNLWQMKNAGSFDSYFEDVIKTHGCGLYKVSK